MTIWLYHNFFLSSERHIPKAQNIEVQYDFPCCLSKIRHPRITKCEKQNSKCRHFSFLLSIIYFPSKIACTTITTFLTPDSISLCSKGATKPKRNLSLLLTFYPKNLSDIFWTAWWLLENHWLQKSNLLFSLSAWTTVQVSQCPSFGIFLRFIGKMDYLAPRVEKRCSWAFEANQRQIHVFYGVIVSGLTPGS